MTGLDHSAQILEVEVDHAVDGEQFGHADDRTDQQLVANAEGHRQREVAHVLNFQQAFVWNDDDRVAEFSEAFKPPLSVLLAQFPFGVERIGHHGDGQRALLFGKPRNMACSTGA